MCAGGVPGPGPLEGDSSCPGRRVDGLQQFPVRPWQCVGQDPSDLRLFLAEHRQRGLGQVAGLFGGAAAPGRHVVQKRSKLRVPSPAAGQRLL